MVGMTMTEKILAAKSGVDVIQPGDLAVCEPDRIALVELMFSIPGLWHAPKKVAHPDRVTVIFDHAVPAPTVQDAEGHMRARAFAKQFGVKTVDVGNHGICHQVIAEQRIARPGEILICQDSHTCAAGAFNCAARGTGNVDTVAALTRGMVWFLLGGTVRYEFSGTLPPWVTGKDVFFFIAEEYGGHSGLNVEFGGSGIATLSLNDRRVIATMCAELSADFAIFEYDEELGKYFTDFGIEDTSPVNPDSDAEYVAKRTIDLAQLEPFIIRPDFVPHNGERISAVTETIKIDQAFLGSCVNGRLEDLRVAADLVRGFRVAPGVRFIVTPASQAVYLQAVKEGIVETLIEAGAVVTNSTCGACFGHHMGVLGPGEVCITASTRNFKGRMGSPGAKIYMGSPATVAAAAIAGEIVDPRALRLPSVGGGK